MAKLDTAEIYQNVTDRFIKALASGSAPWQKPWVGGGHAPRNIRGTYYRGINSLLLSPMISGYDDPRWATFNQTRKLGGKVETGQKSTIVIKWTLLKFEDADAPDGFKVVPSIQYFRVFNIEQTNLVAEGKVPAWVVETDPGGFDPIQRAEAVWSDWGDDAPLLEYAGSRACYAPHDDLVRMPKREKFKSAEGFYSTLWHEGAHATGHWDRLGRFDESRTNIFGDNEYSREELVAEMAAGFVCATVGIEGTFYNSANYLKSWLKKLSDDPKAIIWAASRAQKAADRMLGISPEPEAEPEAENGTA